MFFLDFRGWVPNLGHKKVKSAFKIASKQDCHKYLELVNTMYVLKIYQVQI